VSSGAALAVAALVLALPLAAGCGDDGDGGPAELAGTSWALVSGVDVPADASVTMPTAAFSDLEIAGSGGCNRYGGEYMLDGDAIEIGALAATNIGCADPAGAIESEFFAALEEVGRWSIADDELVLSDAEGVELLRFEPAPSS
jgi:heat shock protein HslJ